MPLKGRIDWKEESFTKNDIKYKFINKGNFFVTLEVSGQTIMTFQLPRADLDRRQLFSFFANAYEGGYKQGLHAGRLEFTDCLKSLVNYE